MKVPEATSWLQRRMYSSSDPSHQWNIVGFAEPKHLLSPPSEFGVLKVAGSL